MIGSMDTLGQLYKPAHDEAARQRLAGGVGDRVDQHVQAAPVAAEALEHGVDLRVRRDIERHEDR